MFMWRACSNILPTKYQLWARGIGRDDECDLCELCETSGHTLWRCKVAGEVWSNTRLKLPSIEIIPKDFVDIVWDILKRQPGIDWELFAATAWVRQPKEEQRRPAPPSRQNWIPPPRGFYKINVDGAVFKELGSCGVGVVIRNDARQLMGAMSKKLDFPLKAMEVEAKVVEEGFTLARELSLKNVILESDAQAVVNSLTESCIAPSSILKVIEGVKLGLCGFDSWDVKHICRMKNSAAHLMAKNAKFVSDYVVWVEDSPSVIEHQVLFDVSGLNEFSY
ncbi:uncharacterized protein LOC142635769 [Castanea sativa]|uniref:uncharacterized protein LOC142635769 n=1 Tax=Castanea sativa TaxID=21020 RepID=UPI003F64F16A